LAGGRTRQNTRMLPFSSCAGGGKRCVCANITPKTHVN
jgi:hypothetical protein